MSHRATSAGMKVTTGDRPVYQEGTGNVAPESLAAESVARGGAFASNPGVEQGLKRSQQQQWSSSDSHRADTGTAANKTTSGILANQQTSRGDEGTTTTQQQQQQHRQQEAQRQQAQGPSDPRAGSNQQGRVLGATTFETVPGAGAMQEPQQQEEPQGQTAPSYVVNQYHRDRAGPHGKNLTEGGFEGSGTAGGPLPEPGSANDPTRAATRDMRAAVASQGRNAGVRQMGGVEGEGEGKSWYTPLKGDESA
ncbi:hypothetical protein N658DRAFT_559945 [Parathielavia hyrcaniae]|uniref:Uncharacterized protein n=1 Tax=Parathielavia hyrcaniae TaxID=113614 RepID=A0AAN6Q0I2_9PEZI|nr:hypothetical protein N658DRAFT_559945 [Parathielavia hyrcaniae]